MPDIGSQQNHMRIWASVGSLALAVVCMLRGFYWLGGLLAVLSTINLTADVIRLCARRRAHRRV